MKIDLFTTSGLPIFFDTDNLEVIADGGYKLEAVSRTVGQLSKVLRFPFEKEPPTEIYRNYLFEQMPEHERQVLAKYNLSYSMVMMPPGIIGSEYAKTMGHYHPPVPGTNLGFPEVYTQLCGTLVLLMQKTAPEKRGDVEEFIAVKMTPGTIVTIPPEYAHVLVNISDEPGLMAGLYGSQTSFKPDYMPVESRKGLAYYLLDESGKLVIEPNAIYLNPPAFQWISDLNNTQFKPVDGEKPVWTSYMENPDLYAFLTQSSALVERFGIGATL
jgi:glucose-6-phosphate isomerase